jgi:pyrroloquinoline quinone (PQQ) biosynthesis protein C
VYERIGKKFGEKSRNGHFPPKTFPRPRTFFLQSTSNSIVHPSRAGELSVEQLRELVDREERRLQARLGALHAMYAQMDRIVQMQLAMQAPLAQYSDT